MQSSDGQRGVSRVLCVLLGCRSLPGAPALPALLWDVAPEAGLWLLALQRSCSRAVSCPRLQRWSCGELGPVCSGDGHHVHPASQQHGQGTRNIRCHSLCTAVVVGMHRVWLGRGVCYWGPAPSSALPAALLFLSFSPAEQEDLGVWELVFYLFASLVEEGMGITV